MTTDWRNALKWGFSGKGSHMPPRRAVQGLTAARATLAPPGGLHSAHRLLHHIVYWQGLILAAIRGKVDWPEGPEDWDCEMAPWDELVRQFEAHLDEANRQAAEEDLTRRMPEWDESMTVGGALTVLITHNSYHLGQLIDVRRLTGCWEEEKKG